MIRTGLCALLLLAACLPTPAWALRCAGRIIQEGDLDVQVRRRCGTPFWVDEFHELAVSGAWSALERRQEIVYEAWFYNFGSKRLMRRLLFRDGHLYRIDELAYGYARLGRDCDNDALISGLTTGEVVARCGAPQSRRSSLESLVERDDAGNERYRPARREEWTYDLRGSDFLRVTIFVDGRLDQVQRLRR